MSVARNHVQNAVPVVVEGGCQRIRPKVVDKVLDIVDIPVACGEEEFFEIVGCWCGERHRRWERAGMRAAACRSESVLRNDVGDPPHARLDLRLAQVRGHSIRLSPTLHLSERTPPPTTIKTSKTQLLTIKSLGGDKHRLNTARLAKSVCTHAWYALIVAPPFPVGLFTTPGG